MYRFYWLLSLIALGICAGCHSDIVVTNRMKSLEKKCVHVSPIQSEEPHIGKVLRDVIVKEFVRSKVELCNPDAANVFLTGTTFLTVRTVSGESRQAIESVSVEARDKEGKILMSASYDNKEQYSASRIGSEFGKALSGKLR